MSVQVREPGEAIEFYSPPRYLRFHDYLSREHVIARLPWPVMMTRDESCPLGMKDTVRPSLAIFYAGGPSLFWHFRDTLTRDAVWDFLAPRGDIGEPIHSLPQENR